MPQLLLTDRIRMIDLVAQDQKGHLGQILHAQQRVELGFRFGEAFMVFGVDEEDDAGYFGEIVFPEATGCGIVGHQKMDLGLGQEWEGTGQEEMEVGTLLMTTQVEGCETAVADSELF